MLDCGMSVYLDSISLKSSPLIVSSTISLSTILSIASRFSLHPNGQQVKTHAMHLHTSQLKRAVELLSYQQIFEPTDAHAFSQQHDTGTTALLAELDPGSNTICCDPYRICRRATSYASSAIFLTASSIFICRLSEVLFLAIMRMIMSWDCAEGSNSDHGPMSENP